MNRFNFRYLVVPTGIAVAYAVALRLFFGVNTWVELFSVMSITFLFLLPSISGFLFVYFSKPEKAAKITYRVFFPWIPMLIFFLITLLVSLEGWACWIMVLPIFLVASSIGGLLGGWRKTRKQGKMKVSLIVLLPLFLAPMESLIGVIPGTYEANTYIDIDAPAERVWSEVVRVRQIPAEQDSGWLTRFLGFPRPLSAELDFEGVGAKREAIFTNGLVFHETVKEYKHQQRMVFSIKAYPHEIPAATMDEHVVIGGKYFDVLEGTYELQAIGENRYRLFLSSRFQLNTTFNFYAGWWAKWIMKDIQNNILRVEKARAENAG